MTITSNFLVALLKYTNKKSITLDDLVKKTNIPINQTIKILKNISKNRIIDNNYELLQLSLDQRIKLAMYSISMGTDVEQVCNVLDWKEFEKFTAIILEKNNYSVKRNFRFKASQRRWEIDVVAFSKPIIICVDCKRWRRGWSNSAITRIAKSQDVRTKAFTNSLPFFQKKIILNDWKKAIIFPIILSLFPGPMKIKNMVPIIPILKFQNFLAEFEGHKSQLKYYKIKLGPKINEFN